MEDNIEKTQSQSNQGNSFHPFRSSLSSEAIYRLTSFFDLMPPLEFRDHLLELYHNYIMHEHDSLPHNFSALAESLPLFLDFLKFADEVLKYPVSETATMAGGE
jgi:hypothetical protein